MYVPRPNFTLLPRSDYSNEKISNCKMYNRCYGLCAEQGCDLNVGAVLTVIMMSVPDSVSEGKKKCPIVSTNIDSLILLPIGTSLMEHSPSTNVCYSSWF